MKGGRHGAAVPPPRRGHYAAIALAFVALALYGSLLPLEFQAVSWDDALGRFRRIPWLSPSFESRSDWVANILLFVPIGFFAAAALRVDRPGRLRAIAVAAVVIPACTLLSLAVEFAQIWCPSRVPSQNDVAAETLGAAAGVALWSLCGRRMTGVAREYASSASPRHKLDLLLQAYLAGFLVYCLLPLDLTISPADLWRKYRDGKVLLVGIGGPPAEVPYVLLSKIATFVPVGLLASTWLLRGEGPGPRHRARPGRRRRAVGRDRVRTVVRPEPGQQRLGLPLGCIGGRPGRRVAAGRHRSSRRRRGCVGAFLGRTTLAGEAVVYAGILVVVFWSPFRFATDKPSRWIGSMG